MMASEAKARLATYRLNLAGLLGLAPGTSQGPVPEEAPLGGHSLLGRAPPMASAQSQLTRARGLPGPSTKYVTRQSLSRSWPDVTVLHHEEQPGVAAVGQVVPQCSGPPVRAERWPVGIACRRKGVLVELVLPLYVRYLLVDQSRPVPDELVHLLAWADSCCFIVDGVGDIYPAQPRHVRDRPEAKALVAGVLAEHREVVTSPGRVPTKHVRELEQVVQVDRRHPGHVCSALLEVREDLATWDSGQRSLDAEAVQSVDGDLHRLHHVSGRALDLDVQSERLALGRHPVAPRQVETSRLEQCCGLRWVERVCIELLDLAWGQVIALEPRRQPVRVGLHGRIWVNRAVGRGHHRRSRQDVGDRLAHLGHVEGVPLVVEQKVELK